MEATWKEPDGIVVVDYNWCIGCRYCMMACPYKARSFVHEPTTTKSSVAPRGKGCVESCTMCVHRVDRGEQPACMVACAAAGYNAGPYAVRDWIAKKPTAPTDVFVEDIPYPATRAYVMQVTATAQTYAVTPLAQQRRTVDWIPILVGVLTMATTMVFLVYPLLRAIGGAFVASGEPLAVENLTFANFERFFISVNSSQRRTLICGAPSARSRRARRGSAPDRPWTRSTAG